MKFALEKTELVHFTRIRATPKWSVYVGGVEVKPVESIRLLRV